MDSDAGSSEAVSRSPWYIRRYTLVALIIAIVGGVVADLLTGTSAFETLDLITVEGFAITFGNVVTAAVCILAAAVERRYRK